jgi:hypothetical protein
MDDWSKIPSRQAVSEPAPNKQSPLNKHHPTECQTQPAASSAPTGADLSCPSPGALDPAGLARQQGSQAGATPRNPFYDRTIPDDHHTTRYAAASSRQAPAATSRWTAITDRAAATPSPAGSPPSNIMSPARSQPPGSWTEIRLGARAHNKHNTTPPPPFPPTRRRGSDEPARRHPPLHHKHRWGRA